MTTPDSPYWARLVENWAVDQHRQHHTEALFLLGENCIWHLKWNVQDFNAGLVDRCPTCYVAHGAIADAYGQASDMICPDCYGTTFEGGIKQTIIRPTLWDMSEPEESEETRRGVVVNQTADVQSTNDFEMRRGDWVVRSDNSRFQIQGLRFTELRTGLAFPSREKTFIGGVGGRAVSEEPISAAFLVPPIDPAVVFDTLERATIEYQPPWPS